MSQRIPGRVAPEKIAKSRKGRSAPTRSQAGEPPTPDLYPTPTERGPNFDIVRYLSTSGIRRTVASYRRGRKIFSQGDPSDSVLYIQQGAVKLTTVSRRGKEAVVAMLASGDFFGESCLVGRSMRLSTATATIDSFILTVDKSEMVRILHAEHDFSDRFISYMVRRNVRIEADLVDHLFNSSEKRLARALLLLSQYGEEKPPQKIIAKVSHETLAEMIGTTRPRITFFMNKFRRLGYIKYNGELQINNALLHAVLLDSVSKP